MAESRDFGPLDLYQLEKAGYQEMQENGHSAEVDDPAEESPPDGFSRAFPRRHDL